MTIALIDNGSLEPAAHLHLRAVAASLSTAVGIPVEPVSWKHSDRIAAAALEGTPAVTLSAWIRAQLDKGETEFIFVPFFISAQGAIGSALQGDLEKLRSELGKFSWSFSKSLASDSDWDSLAEIVTERIRETIQGQGLSRPNVVVVDHGGPSQASASLRDAVTGKVRELLGATAGTVGAASMESPEGAAFEFNRPLLADLLNRGDFGRGTMVIAPLFLSPGRHAGPQGDLTKIALEAEARRPGLKCRFTGLVGTHPRAREILAHHLAAHLPSPAL